MKIKTQEKKNNSKNWTFSITQEDKVYQQNWMQIEKEVMVGTKKKILYRRQKSICKKEYIQYIIEWEAQRKIYDTVRVSLFWYLLTYIYYTFMNPLTWYRITLNSLKYSYIQCQVIFFFNLKLKNEEMRGFVGVCWPDETNVEQMFWILSTIYPSCPFS